MSFSQVGTCLPCPPFSVLSAPFFILSSCSACGGCWWLVVVGGCMRGIGVLEGVGWYCDPWRA